MKRLERTESGRRPAYIEFYDSDGALMLKQGTGITVSGHGSRSYDQKSIKLTSSSQYDSEHPTFDYDFFETDMAGNATGQTYNRLVLRNGGSDHEGTMIKVECGQPTGEGSRHHLCRSKTRDSVPERRVLRNYSASGKIHPVQRGICHWSTEE